MKLQQEDIIKYLASVLYIIRLGGTISPKGSEFILQIQKRIGAQQSELLQAYSAAECSSFKLTPFSRFSTNVQLLEDIVIASIIDDIVVESEKNAVVGFAIGIDISQDQLTKIYQDAKASVDSFSTSQRCPNCTMDILLYAKFCSECGSSLSEFSEMAL
jgi:hypothetical protein